MKLLGYIAIFLAFSSVVTFAYNPEIPPKDFEDLLTLLAEGFDVAFEDTIYAIDDFLNSVEDTYNSIREFDWAPLEAPPNDNGFFDKVVGWLQALWYNIAAGFGFLVDIIRLLLFDIVVTSLKFLVGVTQAITGLFSLVFRWFFDIDTTGRHGGR